MSDLTVKRVILECNAKTPYTREAMMRTAKQFYQPGYLVEIDVHHDMPEGATKCPHCGL